jgi:sulfatase maturation enzyme AslB (radical SAM superfamily)
MLMNLDFRNHVNYSKEDVITKRVRLFTGYQCNYDCKFCFYKGNISRPFDKEIRRQSYMARINGIDSLDISGGEPTILIDWYHMVQFLKSLGFENLAVITNGSTFVNRDFFKGSIERGINEVLFSYHGPSENVHDTMTGKKGSYKRLFNSISNAVELGVKIRINTVVTKDNYVYLPLIAKDILDIQPHCFNFLPFRLENQSTPDNMISYKESIKYIKEAIDILSTNSSIFISVRYLPFCVMNGYEKYVSGWLQKLFDPYEWSQYVFDCLEAVRLETFMQDQCILPSRSRIDLEFESTYNAIKSTTGFSTKCMSCSHKWICEGIWKTYAKKYGVDEFNPIEGQEILDIMNYRRDYFQSFIDL